MIAEKNFDPIQGPEGLAVSIWLCDFAAPTHRLVLACACSIYWTLGLRVLALGVFVNLSA